MKSETMMFEFNLRWVAMFARHLIALDIGSTSVKLLELEGQGARRKLSKMGIELLPPLAVDDISINEPLVLQRALLNLLQRCHVNFKRTDFSLCLNGRSVLVKKSWVSVPTHQDVATELYYHASQLFEIDIRDLSFRYQQLSLPREAWREADGDPYVLVGARSAVVEQRLKLFRQFGLKVAVMDCDIFCLANMLMECIPEQSRLISLLHVGASSSHIVLYQGGAFVDSFALPFGGQHYTNRIREALSCDWENAETFKIYAGMQTAQVPVEVHHVIDDLNEEFAQHVLQALHLGGYTTQLSQGQPAKRQVQGLILSGGGAPTLGLAPSLQHLLGVPTQVFNPLRSVPVKIQSGWQQLVMEQGHLFGPVLGLALRKTGDHLDATS